MRNLKLLYNRNTKLGKENIRHLRVSTDKAGISYFYENDELSSFDWSTSTTNELAPVPNVISIENLSLNNELCVATAEGDVSVLNLDTLTTESVTFCDDGIECMAWSHDQEVVAFVTTTKRLVVMNSAYDPVNECNLDDDDFGDEQFINVGWGKKETQFHGTEGKAAAKQKAEEINIGNVDELDKKVLIAWRGDDEYFVVSFVGRNGRMFKVFDKEGRLKYTSEKVAGLEAAIAWRPSGTWIAIPHVLPNKYTIALFEKNGLRHREIVLPFKNTEQQVVDLCWSSDSEVLAIQTVKENKSIVYLYTICNYYWYLKQTLSFDHVCTALEWDQNYSAGKSLHVILENGEYSIYRWEHTVIHSTGLSNLDQSIVGVIDQSKVLLTNFRGAVIPPPMCAHTANHTADVIQIGFQKFANEADNFNRFFVVDANNTFNIYECSFRIDTERNINLLIEAKLHKSFNFPIKIDISLALHHWHWFSNDRIIVCQNDNLSTIVYLCELLENELKIIDQKIVNGVICNSTIGEKCEKFIYHLVSGEVNGITIGERTLNEDDNLFDVNCLCEQIDAAAVDGETKVILLRNQQNLYIDGNKIAEHVTSFRLTEKFLLFTTLDQLKFVRLDNEQVINERSIERGAKLVVSVPHDSRTIFQMPRGNLEAIQPRVLSICIIGDHLDEGSYRKAFDLLRKQRINLNLLFDHNPKVFLENISKFVEEIDNINWLNLFLTDLQNEDVTQTMYASNYGQLKGTRSDDVDYITNKIEIICERICEEFEREKSSKYLLPIITTHVKRKNLENALHIIWKTRKTELENKAADAAGSVTSHDALKYLLYLVNVNELYDVALGMYDFDLVLFVAQKSQKDPKEYIPFLNELKGFEENYRKYRIDCHLKRHKKALNHIAKCGVEKLEECLDLVEKQSLFTDALRIFRKGDECYSEIVLQYADHLRSKGAFYDACVMYEQGGDYKQALLSARHTLDWRKCITLAKKCNYSEEELQQLCTSLIPGLQENGKFRDAAELVKRYQNDQSLYVKLLCDGKLYQEAIFETESVDFVRNHLTEYAAQLITKIQAEREQFSGYTQRLLLVRQKKAEKLLGGFDDDVDNCDMFSDTSSMNSSRFTGTSRGSGKSHRSSKNRRKHERKLMSLKEGNPFEDIALVDALHSLTHKIYDQQQHIHDVLKAIIDLELSNPLGYELQNEYETSLNAVNSALDKIWIPEMMVSDEVKIDQFTDLVKLQNEQHYAMIKPHQRVKPFVAVNEWPFEILK